MADFEREIDVPNLWATIQAEAGRDIAANPLLTSYLARHLLATNTMAAARCAGSNRVGPSATTKKRSQ